jgi:hypothetical protein
MDVWPGDRHVLIMRPVHTLDVNASGDARSNLISCPNRAPPCTLQCLQCLHNSTSKTVPDMPYPRWDASCAPRSKHAAEAVAEVAVQCFQVPRVHRENFEQVSTAPGQVGSGSPVRPPGWPYS